MIFENQIVFYFEKGDQDYVKYWNEVEMNREDHIYSNIEDGFKKLKKGGQVVMHANDAMVKGAHKSNPYSTPNIKTFGSSKSSYYNLIFTENSPLLPMFKKAAITSFEKGQYDRISLKWQGDQIISNDKRDMVLSSGQVFMNFIFLMSVLFVCFGCLLLEIFCFHTIDKNFESKLNCHKWKLWTKHKISKIRRHST